LKATGTGEKCDTLVAVIEGVTEGVCLTDLAGRIQFINPAAEILTGKTLGEVVGQECSALLGCDDASGCALAKPGSSHTWVESLCRGVRADGRALVMRTRSRVVCDDLGRPTGQLMLFSESSLQESLQNKMVAYERLASLGELAASLVHEVGNPVSVMLGFAQILLRQEGADPDGEIRNRIFLEATRCRKIVDQFLGYARSSSQSRRMVPLGLEGIVRETLDLLDYRLKRRGARPNVSWDPDVPLVLADPGEMKQVFLNLFLNALQAMEREGEIHVRGRGFLRPETVGGGSLLTPVASVVGRAWLEIRIEDEGPGLGEGDPERLFVPFFSTKEKGGGLGLSVCRRIVRERGGEVRLENRPGGGTCAVIELPGYEFAEAPAAPA
jgi:PAS domain S-box-containing protein